MKIIHFVVSLAENNGMANTARQFVAEEIANGIDSKVTNSLAEVAEADGLDVLHIHGTWLPVLWKVSALAKRKGAKVIVRPAGNYDPIRRRRGFISRLKKLAVRGFERAMLERADVIQATCDAEAEWIADYCPSVRGKIELTDLKRFFDLNKAHEIGRVEVDVEERPLRILFLGRADDPLKGVRFLREAVEVVNSQFGNAYSHPAVELRVETRIFGEEKEKAWQWADVLCLPTLSENFGRVVAESLEHGVRAITTDGAPVWKGHDGVAYLEGFRNGSDALRVELLKGEILSCMQDCGG